MKSIISSSILMLCILASSANATITAETTVSSSLSPEQIEHITQAVITLSKTSPHLMKVGALNLAGLICSCSGMYVLVKGIQQSCAANKEENNEQNECTSFLKRCMNTLTNASAKGTYQSGAGLALFLLGLSSIASSERILALCA